MTERHPLTDITKYSNWVIVEKWKDNYLPKISQHEVAQLSKRDTFLSYQDMRLRHPSMFGFVFKNSIPFIGVVLKYLEYNTETFEQIIEMFDTYTETNDKGNAIMVLKCEDKNNLARVTSKNVNILRHNQMLQLSGLPKINRPIKKFDYNDSNYILNFIKEHY